MDAAGNGMDGETGGIRLSFETAVTRRLKRLLMVIQLPQKLDSSFCGSLTPCLLALSGGADSTAMTAALAALRDAGAAIVLTAVHVNHGIRAAADCAGDEAAAAALCKGLNIPLAVKTIPPGLIEAYAHKRGTGIEGAARHFRHRALQEEARRSGARVILIAHTRDDRLETTLMALLRGAGPAGLGAMAEYREGKTRDSVTIPILRPLLSLGRADVLAYLKERRFMYRDDATNKDEHFLRNRVRCKLIPLLDQHFPRWRKPVQRLGETQAMTAVFLAEEAARLLPWKEEPDPPGVKPGSRLVMAAEVFFSQPEILREEVLFGALDRIAVWRQNQKQRSFRREVLRSFCRGETSALDLGNGIRLELAGGKIALYRETPAASIPDPAESMPNPAGERGLSLLIKNPGVYKLEGLTVRAAEGFGIDAAAEETVSGQGFFASFPLAVCFSRGKIQTFHRPGGLSGWFTVQTRRIP
ncbi:hypothetical protein AGMMS50230_09810 [Spirochaetia bacterium]|nr:hypothetical protein AGMMS50230_09810 [Spirochaetia bacterium]